MKEERELKLTKNELELLSSILNTNIDLETLDIVSFAKKTLTIEEKKQILESLRSKLKSSNFITLKDLNIISLDNWYKEDSEYTLYVDCGMNVDGKIIDSFFGVDLMENGKKEDYLNEIGLDFYYVLSFGYNVITKAIKLCIDFCVESDKFPKGYSKEIIIKDEDYEFIYNFLVESIKEYKGLSLEDYYIDFSK